MGDVSGRNAFKVRMRVLVVEFDSEEELNNEFSSFKALVDKKHDIFDEDLQALVTEAQAESTEVIRLISLKVCTESGKENTADITLLIDGKEKSASAKTSGAVDATFNAILSLDDIDPTLQLYSVTNVTQGTDSLG